MYNRDNVLLVDVREAPIERITPSGIKTSDAEYELDVIIFATGYDAVTGSLTRIDIRGEGGQTIKDRFAQGPRTYMGLQSAGFPNLFTMPGAGAGNFTRSCEPLVEWVSDCIGYMRENEFTRISATPQAEEAWTRHVAEASANLLRTKANSWFVGGEHSRQSKGLARQSGHRPSHAGQSVTRWRPMAMKGFCFNRYFTILCFGIGDRES